MSGFTANGAIYIQGGSDGSNLLSETLWATPDADGVIPLWQTLSRPTSAQGIEGAAAVVSAGSHGFLFGGRRSSGLTGGAARTNLAPAAAVLPAGAARRHGARASSSTARSASRSAT